MNLWLIYGMIEGMPPSLNQQLEINWWMRCANAAFISSFYFNCCFRDSNERNWETMEWIVCRATGGSFIPLHSLQFTSLNFVSFVHWMLTCFTRSACLHSLNKLHSVRALAALISFISLNEVYCWIYFHSIEWRQQIISFHYILCFTSFFFPFNK